MKRIVGMRVRSEVRVSALLRRKKLKDGRLRIERDRQSVRWPTAID
jgi:hypothetical protein